MTCYCKEVCHRYALTWDESGSRTVNFDMMKVCTVCDKRRFSKHYRKCPCCGVLLRTKPRASKCKKIRNEKKLKGQEEGQQYIALC